MIASAANWRALMASRRPFRPRSSGLRDAAASTKSRSVCEEAGAADIASASNADANAPAGKRLEKSMGNPTEADVNVSTAARVRGTCTIFTP